ncbi:S-methyl-5-thioribose-1-phosphate isomerase [Thermodesulfovibrio yellowstonii]|uniref:Methylthioribose-1-phosphate isomerase n=1 Tax=Thermodesulfovibrio yellowstonii TaxID=28262 RepID=A0A9W6GG60_9BACT|nr:methylthioribose-1-phosphate isomerase [Thermodesulfovibrio islandicus]
MPMLQSIKWENNTVYILDQRLLPDKVEYLKCTHYEQIARAIENLSIRGAPAIGIAAAWAVAVASKSLNASSSEELFSDLNPVFQRLINTRPTAVNIKWAIDRMQNLIKNNRSLPVSELKDMILNEAIKIHNEDIQINKRIGEYALEFFKDGCTVITYCNAGALATGGYGTATAPMYLAKEKGIKFKVIACETRPVLQGARITAFELMQAGIDVTLICDNTAGALLRKGMIDFAIVGTDRTVRNGDVANKIGTYSLSVLCKENNVPFYVAAPTSSIDLSIPSGDMIPIEERSFEEVTTIKGVKIAPEGINVINFAFDVTPAKYVTAIITEKGIFKPSEIQYLRLRQ